jgi:DHA1 family inner membrane transport protein
MMEIAATGAKPAISPQAPPERARAALLLLAAGAFIMGTTEFIIVGVLDLVAGDLGLPVATAGQLVMAYALGISVGGPLLSAMLAGWCRKRVLLLSLGLFALANVAMVLGGDFALLLAARFVPGSMHGLFVGVASVMAARLVPPGQQGRAMALVSSCWRRRRQWRLGGCCPIWLPLRGVATHRRRALRWRRRCW